MGSYATSVSADMGPVILKKAVFEDLCFYVDQGIYIYIAIIKAPMQSRIQENYIY